MKRIAHWLICGLALMVSVGAWARGLAFSEEMHGYAYVQGEFRPADVYLNVVINDIDAWRSNPNVAAGVSGTLYLGGLSSQPINGTLQILAPAAGFDGRLLTYRFKSASVQFTGAKHVRDQGGLEVVDDMTTLHGLFQPLGQTAPSIYDLLYHSLWSTEFHFEWWKADVVWDFFTSFTTIDTPWYEELYVKALFLQTVLGTLAHILFPWLC